MVLIKGVERNSANDSTILECIEIRHAALVKKRQVGVWGKGGPGGVTGA
jgi:hypothetical protein